MNLAPNQDHSPQPESVTLAEFGHVVKERRFVMTSYMRALVIYLGLSGYGLLELSKETIPFLLWVVGILMTVTNGLAIYAAGRFKSMAIHAMQRERQLALQLKMGEPHSMLWGYGSGVILVVVCEITVIGLVVWKIRALGW